MRRNSLSNVVRVSHLRGHLGAACRQVAETGEPIVVQRYNACEVALVPLAEWERMRRLAEDVEIGLLAPVLVDLG